MQSLSRRQMLTQLGTGLGMAGLAGIMCERSATAAPATISPLAPRLPHYAPKVKHVIHIYLNGG
ncbi:MAG: DUF1501 domain-containing protein, partial [Pirellulaceae bacterium]|nr:DUF1501 domain-containing protein [Pirellulaceae bacterium]